MWQRALGKIAVLSVLLLVFAGQVGAAEEERLGEKLAPEGFGAVSKGGAGGRVIWVTTLNPAGPGSFNEAVDSDGPRIIKFKVGGEIRIPDNKPGASIRIGWPHRPEWKKARAAGAGYDSPNSFVTIDGASAPEPGITFTNGGLYVGYGVHDVIIRHIRIKHGSVGGAGGDGICMVYTKRVLIDHCTVTEAVDEAVEMHKDAKDVTVQWCIIAAGSTTGHPKGFDHSAGPFFAYGATRATLHHNLIAKNRMRNPMLYGDYHATYGKQERPICDAVNNVNFGCHQGALVGAGMRANLIGNLYLRQHAPAIWIVTKYPAKPMLYLRDNIIFRNQRILPADVMTAGKMGMCNPDLTCIVKEPFRVPAVKTQSALEAAKLVLAHAGARPWARNELETSLIAEAREAAAKALEQHSKSVQPKQPQ